MEKLLTIVIPTYNMEELLPRCLDSLVTPVINDKVEVLVVNDGSKDNSLKIAQTYEKKYPNVIKAIDKENGNYGSTINKGIEIASGKYFRILDSDDFYSNSGLIELVNRIENTDVDIILTNYRRDRGRIHDIYKGLDNLKDLKLDFDEVDLSLFPNFAMHGITYKTSILRENNIRLQTGISYTDSEYCFYPLPFVKTMEYYDLLVYCYQVGRPGQTVDIKSQVRSIPHMVKIINRMYEYLKGVSVSESYFQKLKRVFCNSMNLCFSTALCYDKNNSHLIEIDKMKLYAENICGVNEVLLEKNMFGVKYYMRYVEKGKTSNSTLFIAYYSMIRSLARLYFTMKSSVL